LEPVDDGVRVSSSEHTAADYWLVNCDGIRTVEVSVHTENPLAVVSYNGKQATLAETGNQLFAVDVSKPAVHHETYTISYAGREKTHSITIESRFTFDALISQKWDNLLVVDNISAKNLGYVFTGYQWYCDDVLLPGETRQYYSAGNALDNLLHPDRSYYVELILDNGDKMHTCPTSPTLKYAAAALKAYPNPAKQGQAVQIEIPDQYANEEIRIYSATGQLVKSLRVNGPVTEATLNLPAGLYIIHIKDIQTKIVIEN
jgi:hypothetical protein